MTPLQLPNIPSKPRTSALNMVLEKGLDPFSFEQALKYNADKIDIVKFTSGIALVDNGIKEKIALCKKYDIDVYFGGTLFEKFYHQNLFDEYLQFLESMEITSIEISDGTLPIPSETRVELIKSLKQKGFQVYVEIGSKDTEHIMPPSEWIDQMKEFLNAGADYIITEARESGTAGLFRTSGEVREGLLRDILKNIDQNKIIFEAPNKNSQCFFINKISPLTNLGNIPLSEINMLEVQRRGLRFDTFFVQ